MPRAQLLRGLALLATGSAATAATIEEMYAGALTSIRENPNPAKPKSTFKPNAAFKKPVKKTLAERKETVVKKKAAQAAKLAAALAAAGDDE